MLIRLIMAGGAAFEEWRRLSLLFTLSSVEGLALSSEKGFRG